MRRIIETGNEDALNEERIQLIVSTGAGNTPQPEIHIALLDPLTGEEIRAWFYRDDALAALLDPDADVRTTAILGATLEEPTA